MRKFRAVIEIDDRYGYETLEKMTSLLKDICEDEPSMGHWADVISVEKILPEKKETTTTGSLSNTCGPRSLHPSAYKNKE